MNGVYIVKLLVHYPRLPKTRFKGSEEDRVQTGIIDLGGTYIEKVGNSDQGVTNNKR